MGTCYTYLLFDEFDWGYRNKSKDETIEDLKKELPVAEVLAQWSDYVVVDLDKNSPWGDNVQLLRKYCDSAYYYGDTGAWDLQKVKFKKPKVDPTSILAPPAQRIDRRTYYKELTKKGNLMNDQVNTTVNTELLPAVAQAPKEQIKTKTAENKTGEVQTEVTTPVIL